MTIQLREEIRLTIVFFFNLLVFHTVSLNIWWIQKSEKLCQAKINSWCMKGFIKIDFEISSISCTPVIDVLWMIVKWRTIGLRIMSPTKPEFVYAHECQVTSQDSRGQRSYHPALMITLLVPYGLWYGRAYWDCMVPTRLFQFWNLFLLLSSIILKP